MRGALSTSATPDTSRMAPRGAGISACWKCCPRAFVSHVPRCQSWTYPARTSRATEKTTSAPWTIPNRLRRITWSATRQDDELGSGGDGELEALFGDRCEPGPAGGGRDRPLERFPLGD